MEPNKYIDPVKTGKFIARLRESHNWTQDELGSRIFISRKSVSKWETGKCCPSIDMVKKLSEVFGVSFDEMIAGEFLDKNGKEITGFRKILNNKAVRITAISLVAFLFATLVGFFIYNYNSTRVYEVYYEDDNFVIEKGVIILSHAKNYINLGSFYSNYPNTDDNTEYELTLYYKNEDDYQELITFKSDKVYFNDKNVSNEYLTKTIKENIERLVLKVSFTDNKLKEQTVDLKLNIELDFKNNFVFSIKNNIIALLKNDSIPELEVEDIEEKTNNSTIAQREPVNVEFLYNLTPKELKKKYNGKSIKIDDEKYTIKYNNELNMLKVYSESNDVNISLNSKRIEFISDKLTLSAIDNDYNVFFNSENMELYTVISNMIRSLKAI